MLIFQALIQCAANPAFINAQVGAVAILHTWGQTLFYCEKPFSSVNNLIRYLGNYTHRVAISNHRIIEYRNGKVIFSFKDYKSSGLSRNMTLEAGEFIRRFMQHILPCGFYKIRYFGFMAMCNMKLKLQSCFDLIDKVAFLPVLEGLTSMEVWQSITPIAA